MWAAVDGLFAKEESLNHLVLRLDEGYDYLPPDIEELKDSDQSKTLNVMKPFDSIDGYYHIARKSITSCSYQIYGVFRISILKDYWKYVDYCIHLICFGVGLLIDSISMKINSYYV